jgi:nitrite reductase/ring-hydroxylating ferredoxin subunit
MVGMARAEAVIEYQRRAGERCGETTMRSHAHFKAHPLHPALIPFPFAFLSGALLFDLIGLLRANREMIITGGHLTVAGLIAGVLAAIPGALDYLYTVPPKSSGKQRATKHAIGNVIALVLFALAFAMRDRSWQATAPTLGFELFGTAALLYAGWMGGTLVTRNLISVDHRYAQAGKWQELDVTAAAGASVVVGHVDDLKEDQMKLLRVNGHRIVLARTSTGYHACEDRCTHRGGSLAGGVLAGGVIQCLWHGSQFDPATGRAICGPARTPIRAFEVKETKNGQLVLVSPPE